MQAQPVGAMLGRVLLLPPTRCGSVADVAAAVRDARAGGQPPALDLTALDGVTVDPLRRIVRVGPGAAWAQLDAVAAEHGLAVTGARDARTRVLAATVAGGSGWLERRFGLASDNLRAARLVTAGGELVDASEFEQAELFWALRGGGGGLGVVVELELVLRPLGPAVLGGTLRWPAERAGAVARAYRDLLAGAPDAVCGGLVLSPAGATVVFLYAGAPERGARHLAALRALRPVVDDVAVRSYPELQSALPGGDPGGYLAALTDDAIEALARPRDEVLLLPLGGAYARHEELATAAGPRAAAWAYRSCAPVPGSPAADPAAADRAARLAAVKRRWDPEDVFGGPGR